MIVSCIVGLVIVVVVVWYMYKKKKACFQSANDYKQHGGKAEVPVSEVCS